MNERSRLVPIGIIAAVVILGAILIALDWKEARRMFVQADWRLIPFVLFFTSISYFSLSSSFAIFNRLFGINMRRRDLMEVGFVSFTAGYLVSMGGVTGYSLQVLLMRKWDQRPGTILVASFFYSYFNGIVMVGLLPFGLINLLKTHSLDSRQGTALILALLVLIFGIIAASLFIFIQSIRSALLHFIEGFIFLLIHKTPEKHFESLNDTIERGLRVIRGKPLVLVLPLCLTIVDWFSCAAALWYCFDAFGEPVSPGILLTGFSVGIVAGILSMIPGGLGVQEGTMSWVYSLFGIPLEHAVLTSILFRVLYYFVPFLASLILYRRLLK